jgi:uncharacterized repeat protein (TIGR02543 family)
MEIEKGSTGDIELFAKWMINNYNLNYAIFNDDSENKQDIPLYIGESIIQVSLGNYHSAALTSEGRLFTWGSNQNGQLGDGTTTDKLIPVDITTLFNLNQDEKIIQISLGTLHSSAITSKGRIFMWGYNAIGQLGDGTTTDKLIPVDITTLFNLSQDEKIIQVSLGFSHSSALTSEGRIYTWGYNFYGQLGNGITAEQLIPVDITTFFNLNQDEIIIQISLGTSHSSALTSQGRIFTWGSNTYGQLGYGEIDYEANHTPIDITSSFDLEIEEKITLVSLGGSHSSVITSSGRIFMWGNGSFGQIGNGMMGTVKYPVPIDITAKFSLGLDEKINKVTLGTFHSSAITSSGRIFTWGYNGYGQLGNNPSMSQSDPTDITVFFNLLYEEIIIDVNLGANSSSVITSEGRVFTWGDNKNGQLGDGSLNNKYTPIVIVDDLILDKVVTYFYNEEISYYLPEMDGYTFDGWYVDATLETVYTFTIMPEKDITLYGRWVLN